MEKALGIGGFFFRAKDPDALARWYQTHLGIAPAPTNEGATVWAQEAGPTVFTPFPADTEYFGDAGKGWMLNLRVRDLAAIVAQLTAGGVEVNVDPSVSSIGRFARLYDPEGNPIELWQPMGTSGTDGPGPTPAP